MNMFVRSYSTLAKKGALNFFFVGRDVRGGSPKWPGAFVFRGGYHPRKTSCKSTVGANRLAGPIMS